MGGGRVGRYRILRRLAAGGMAELHLAHVEGVAGFEKLVVLKRILPHLAEEADFTEMFVKEARVSAILDHPNIVQVLDSGRFRGEFFYVMEYVHGRDARSLLGAAAKAGRPIPLACAVSIAIGAASGLHYAHERADLSGRPLGLVHRDVSPSNLLVSYDGAVKVSDFGIAKASARTDKTLGSTIKGKIGYMAPEQARGATVDRRTDVYALGVLLYELSLTQRAFVADNEFAVFNAVLTGALDRPSVRDPAYPPELERIVLKATSLDPQHRYPTARAFVEDLEAFAAQCDLRVGAGAVARYVESLVGKCEYPRAEAAADPEAARGLSTDGTVVLTPVGLGAVAPRPRPARWPVIVGAAGLAAGLAVAVAAPFSSTSANAEASPPAAPEQEEEQEPAPPAPPTDVATAQADMPPPAPVVSETPPEPAPVAETKTAAPESPARRKSRRRSKQRQRRPRAKKERPKVADPDALYPL